MYNSLSSVILLVRNFFRMKDTAYVILNMKIIFIDSNNLLVKSKCFTKTGIKINVLLFLRYIIAFFSPI
jgi:hypothetical protein